ncbi:preprotein translocase subunit SecE [Pueribacillus theae]|uniref:Protein translocase subunit SecE n=1 Tax=Pueribacillus theae TaxID=2171751 RepID=A0A2U1K7V3_9BACI|nr:preprotein translocase subunit SecE [Pueribacillus theae]PWA12968.1 preprotein translocase subunit SecE [Pueribacillus theae]
MFKKAGKFLKNVVNEMKQVRWPTKKELVKYTITVIATVAFVTVFFVIVDFGISSLIQFILE